MVLKTADLKESDKLVYLYTERFGKVTAVAKGAKKNKSKFLSLSLPFCYGNFVLFSGKSLYNITEGEIIESFQGLLNNLDNLTYASYFCELIDISMQEGENSRELFKDLVTCFYLLKSEAADIELLARAFEIKLLKATGYELNLDNCVQCKNKISTSDYINLDYLGGTCENCERTGGIYIRKPTYNALRVLSKIPLENIYRVSLGSDVKKELYKVLSACISLNYSRAPRSLEFFNYLKGVESHE